MFRFNFISLAVLVPTVLVGCAVTTRPEPYVEAVPTHDFNPTDLQIIGTKSVADLMAQAQKVFPEGTQPKVYVARIRNLTDEHIDTDMIAEYIAVQLSQNGKVQLIERSKAFDEAIKELEFQRGAFVDPETTRKVGRMVGADYFVQGELSNMVSKAGWKKGQYFQFTLSLVDVETLKVWKSLVAIQKVTKRGLTGW